jgi:hypothetical protein
MKLNLFLPAAIIVAGLLSAPLIGTTAAEAKSTNAATGIGKDGTPPGLAKGAGEPAAAYAPGLNKEGGVEVGGSDGGDDDNTGVTVQ